MKNKKYSLIGNITIVLTRNPAGGSLQVLLGKKKPKKKSKKKNPKKKRIGVGFWQSWGGQTKHEDTSQRHAARRELGEETELFLPLSAFRNMGRLTSTVFTTKQRLWLVHLYVVFLPYSARHTIVFSPDEYTEARWYNIERLPSHMPRGDKVWMPRLIKGERLAVEVLFDDETLQETRLPEVESLGHVKPWL